MKLAIALVTILVLVGSARPADRFSPSEATRFVASFREAVEAVNRAHADAPGKTAEAELRDRLPKSLSKGLDRLLAMEPSDAKWEALIAYAEAAAELDLADGIARVEKELRGEGGSPAAAERLGQASPTSLAT